MMLVCAIGALGAVGCVATGDAADDNSVAQATSSGSGFVCSNKETISVVQCVGSIAVLPINVNISNIGVLDQSKLDILSGDLNNLKIENILNENDVLSIVKSTVLDDLLKDGIDVSKVTVNVCTLLNVCL
jgi:hypothetical protein